MSVLTAVFRTASRLRSARVFHPRGVVLHATWRPAADRSVLPGSALLEAPRPALLRLSRGVGLPPGIPDVLGVAVKVLDVYGPGRDQDLLLASSGTGRLGRHLLRPTRQLTDTVMSTLLPYDIAGVGRHPIVARSRPGSRRTRYLDVLREGPTRVPVFEIRIGRVDGLLLGSVHPGTAVSQAVGEQLRYDPWHTGPQLRPRGWLNRIRRPTYAASQDGRGAPPGGARPGGRG